MALAKAVKGARKIAQQITWTDEDGTAVNLTGTTITAVIRNKNNKGSVRAADGAFSLVTPASGIFSWAYGSADTGTAGEFEVQFTATYADTLKELSLLMDWEVEDQLVAA